jgi:hypothetical protein
VFFPQLSPANRDTVGLRGAFRTQSESVFALVSIISIHRANLSLGRFFPAPSSTRFPHSPQSRRR